MHANNLNKVYNLKRNQMIEYIDTSQLPRDQNTTTVVFRNRKDIKFHADFLVSIIVLYKYPHVANYRISLGNIYHKFQGNTTFAGYGLPVMSQEVSIDFDMPPASCVLTIRKSEYRDLLQVACRYPLRFAIGMRYWTCGEGRYSFTDVADQCKVSFVNIFAMRKTTQRYRTLNLLELKFVQMYNIFRTNRNTDAPNQPMPSDDILQIMKKCTLPKIIAPLPSCIKFGSNCVCVHDGEEHIADQWLNQLQHPNLPKRAPWENFHVKTQILASRADQIQKHIERVAAFRAICKMAGGTSQIHTHTHTHTHIDTAKDISISISMHTPMTIGVNLELPAITNRNITISGIDSAEKYPEFHFAARKNSRALVKLNPSVAVISYTPQIATPMRQPIRQLRVLSGPDKNAAGPSANISAAISSFDRSRSLYNTNQPNSRRKLEILGSNIINPRQPVQTIFVSTHKKDANFPQKSRRALVCLQKR